MRGYDTTEQRVSIRREIVRDIIDKLNGLYLKQVRVFIKTRPTATFPRGKIHNGPIRHIDTTYVSILDDVEGFIDIFFSQIESPDEVRISLKERP